MGRFFLEDDEDLKKQCGEIFLTTKGRISFHCTLCEEAFSGFESYQTHLNEVHLSTNIKVEIDLIDPVQQSFALTDALENYLEEELKDVGNEIEEMVSIGVSDSDSWSDSVSMQDENQINSAHKETKASKTDLTLPGEIREVVKRTSYKMQTITEKDRKHKCPICHLGFKDKGNMTKHFKRHSNERNYACSVCLKKFYSSTEANHHMKSHTQERTLLCPECGRMFATKSTLGSHLKRHRNQRDYICQYSGCKKAFYNSSLLKNHMLSHSSVRSFCCSICNAAFKRSIALKNHMKLHENKRAYKCQICNAGFNQQAGLFSHLKTVHKSV